MKTTENDTIDQDKERDKYYELQKHYDGNELFDDLQDINMYSATVFDLLYDGTNVILNRNQITEILKEVWTISDNIKYISKTKRLMHVVREQLEEQNSQLKKLYSKIAKMTTIKKKKNDS